MKLLALGVILGALAGLWVIARKRQLFHQEVIFGDGDFQSRWNDLPKVECGIKERFR